MKELISLFCHQTCDSAKLTLIHKILKAARFAMADRIVLNCINTEPLAANTQKKQRAQRTFTQYNVQRARVLSLEAVEKRRRPAENKKKEKEAKSQARKKKQDDQLFFMVSKGLMRLGPDLIYGPNPDIYRKIRNETILFFKTLFTIFFILHQIFLRRQLWVN